MSLFVRLLPLSILFFVSSLMAGEAVPNADAPDAAADKPCPCKVIPKVRTLAGDGFDIAFHSRIQVWGGWTGDDSLLTNGDRLQEYGFRLRRARFGVDGGLFDSVKYKLEMDLFDQEKTGGPLYAAWVDYTPSHWFGVRAGVDKFLFSKAAINSSAKLAHLDRALGTDAMSPGQTLGVSLHTEPWVDHLTIQVGAYNGLQRKAGFYQGYEGVGVSLGNRYERMSFAGRVDLVPLDPMGCGEADVKKTESFRVSLGGGGFYNDGKSITGFGYSGYLHMKAWGAHLFAEALFDHSEPTAKPTTENTIPAEIDRMAIQASLGYMILAKKLGVAFRTELIDDNSELDNEGDELVLAGTLTWYHLGNYLKTILEYQHREEQNGQSIDNDYVIAGVQFAF